MSCSKEGEETRGNLQGHSGQPGFSEARNVFNCPRGGRFVARDLVCSNPNCGADWRQYAHLADLSLEEANLRLRLSDPFAAISPDNGEAPTPLTKEWGAQARSSQRNGNVLLAGGTDIEDMNIQVQIVRNREGKEQAVLLKDGLSLYSFPPVRINTNSKKERRTILAALRRKGVKELGGGPSKRWWSRNIDARPRPTAEPQSLRVSAVFLSC